MPQQLRDIQFFRNSNVSTLDSYDTLLNKMRTMVSNDTDGVFKDGQLILGRYNDSGRIRSVGGIVCVNGGNKYIDFIISDNDLNVIINQLLRDLDGEATIANLQNGVLTLKKVSQTNGEISTGSDICVLYLDTNMSSNNPLLAESTVDQKIQDERNKNYINSSLYQSGTPFSLTEQEIQTLSGIYQTGHIVFDSNTNRFLVWNGNSWAYPTVSATIQSFVTFNIPDEVLVLREDDIELVSYLYIEGYAPIFEQPSDWSTNWDKYYLWDDTTETYYLNTSNIYNVNNVYYVKYKLPLAI